MDSTLDQLKKLSTVVADTGDIEAIKNYQPIDATTNPSLLYKAAQFPQYNGVLQTSIQWAKQQETTTDRQVKRAMDKFAVMIGAEILSIIPGRVSTEVDARLSFDTSGTIAKAKELVELYDAAGIGRDRILIKIAATWEGIQAAKLLEEQNIQCNLTLLFSLTQAVVCADARAFLISPFVGRILDWYKQHTGKEHYKPEDDPGVQSVTKIYHYYKQHGVDTIVMGASFRSIDQVLALAGCDRLTISPQLLAELQADRRNLDVRLSMNSPLTPMEKITLDEKNFRYQLNNNAMATEKLAEGIRNFVKDQEKMEELIRRFL